MGEICKGILQYKMLNYAVKLKASQRMQNSRKQFEFYENASVL